jgi:catechol 2,3-dioxygenase-like lactoylglutathione lyase family enzyme
MNRFHVHLNVSDLQTSVGFYSALFDAEPTVLKSDYAKWMLEDPRVNFAISALGRTPGVDHLGIQAEDAEALAALGRRLDAAGGTVIPEAAAICCYAQSDKAWTADPQGTRWETFHTIGEATSYYSGDAPCATDGAACTPHPVAMQPYVDQGKPCCGPKAVCC